MASGDNDPKTIEIALYIFHIGEDPGGWLQNSDLPSVAL